MDRDHAGLSNPLPHVSLWRHWEPEDERTLPIFDASGGLGEDFVAHAESQRGRKCCPKCAAEGRLVFVSEKNRGRHD